MTVVSVREKLSATRAYRLESIDMVRGLVIVIMAIDHVRDYFNFGGEPDPMANPDVGAALFFTRWITHFCAPVFVFLAGTSAGLMTSRKTQSALGAFLFKRGVWLICHRVVCRCHRLELCAVGNRAARWARRRCDAGDMGHRREHGRPGGRAVPWTARVSRHRRCDPGWSQSARSDMAGHERHLRHRPSMVGGVARPDGNREWTVLSS